MGRKAVGNPIVNVQVSKEAYYTALLVKQSNREKYKNVAAVFNEWAQMLSPDHHVKAEQIVKNLAD